MKNKDIKLKDFFSKLNDSLFVCYQPNFEDFRAVLSSKVSREIILQRKSDMNINNIEKFLLENLAKYNHASIGEMCLLTIYHFGFGWVSSFLLTNDCLFIGQEVSSRAVNILKKIQKPCYDSKSVVYSNESFRFFRNIFIKLQQNINTINGAYKFDYVRWALPGNISTGVIFNMNGRVLSRHLNSLKNFKFMKKIIQQYELGFKTIAPNIFISLDRKRKNINTQKKVLIKRITHIDKQKLCFIKWINKPQNIENIIAMLIKKYEKNVKLEYLPLEFKKLGLFEINIHCSIAAARDWHRHRPVMPWTLTLLLNQNSLPIIHPLYEIYGYTQYENEINCFFEEKKIFHNLKSISWEQMYVLPFGTSVDMNCCTTLDFLFYMLKLRSNSSNANFEYKTQANMGLKILKQLLPMSLIEHFHLQ